MRILILGGTRFVGRHLVQAAMARGHEVTLFNRGESNPGLFPSVKELHGDRDGDLTALEEALAVERWDAVIDTCGYVPRVVRASTELLANEVPHYTFISTISVYADFTTEGLDESSPVATMADETVEEITHETYGPLKRLCEQVVEGVYPDGALIIRPGLIVGPHDPTDRFTYWPVRVAEGGEVLAPGTGEAPVQFIDGRDLAAWTIKMVEERATGTFNATGPASTLSLREFLETTRRRSDSDAAFVWVDEAFLLEAGAEPWMEIPLWIPGEEAAGIGTVNVDKAIAAGLTFRPLAETMEDTRAWAEKRPGTHEWRAGLRREREEALLTVWAAEKKEEDD